MISLADHDLHIHKTEQIRCPNCGNYAQREYYTHLKLMQTSCQACDYLMVNCPETGKVFESYAPGIESR